MKNIENIELGETIPTFILHKAGALAIVYSEKEKRYVIPVFGSVDDAKNRLEKNTFLEGFEITEVNYSRLMRIKARHEAELKQNIDFFVLAKPDTKLYSFYVMQMFLDVEKALEGIKIVGI